jgi:von Willebrand factor type A domain-containing protein/type IX secretion system substrate protein
MQTTQRKALATTFIIVVIALLMANTSQAQPVLNFKRVVNNWPTVELYFTVACNGQPEYNFNKEQNFKVVENGIEIGTFTLWCPDPRVQMPISVSLVFDASGSMVGARNADAKAAGNAFIDSLDGVVDEAAVSWFNSTVITAIHMTSNKTDLHAGMNALPSALGSKVWDGIYAGVQELISGGNNPVRRVIALVDGQDNSSNRTPQDIISLANRNRIPVDIIGLGGVSPAQLQTIALVTGGSYYVAQTSAQLDSIYHVILSSIRSGHKECLITYQAKCMDGGLRTVDLTLKNFCNGNDTKTKTYLAPKDTTTYMPLEIAIGDAAGTTGDTVTVPLVLNTPIIPMDNFEPATYKFLFDTQCIEFLNITAPTGTLLNGVPITIDPISGGVSFTTMDRTQINGNGILALMQFKILSKPADSSICPINLSSWVFEAGCFKPVLQDGRIITYNTSAPSISIIGDSIFCEGEHTVLRISPGFKEIHWSTGATTDSIIVTKSGNYTVAGTNGLGQRLTSDAFLIDVLPAPRPVISASGALTFCEGDSAVLTASSGFGAYRWSTNQAGESISVKESGEYFVEVRSANGCWGRSDTIEVSVGAAPAPMISPQGPLNLCEGDSALMTIEPGYESYRWSNNDTTRSIRAKTSGTYFVDVLNSSGCWGRSNTVEITFHPYPAIPTITQLGNVLSSSVTGQSYKWYMNGTLLPNETQQSITITKPADYRVTVINAAGCEATSETKTATGIDRFAPTLAKEFDVSPNPSNGSFMVSLEFDTPTSFSIQMVDVTGKLVKEVTVARKVLSYRKELTLNIRPGIYFAVLRSGVNTSVRRMVIH